MCIVIEDDTVEQAAIAELEEALAQGRRLVKFLLPAANGGRLEMATDLVEKRLQQVVEAGLDAGDAAIFLANSKAHQAARRFRQAYALLVRAYGELL